MERELNGAAVDQVLASESAAGTVSWYLADNQETVRDVVQLSGTTAQVVDHVIYDAFGVISSQTGAQPTITFDGMWQDPDTDLDKSATRWYDPSTGGWLSQDLIGFNGGQTNVSEFCGNSPTNEIDPSGNLGEWTDWFRDVQNAAGAATEWLPSSINDALTDFQNQFLNQPVDVLGMVVHYNYQTGAWEVSGPVANSDLRFDATITGPQPT